MLRRKNVAQLEQMCKLHGLSSSDAHTVSFTTPQLICLSPKKAQLRLQSDQLVRTKSYAVEWGINDHFLQHMDCFHRSQIIYNFSFL